MFDLLKMFWEKNRKKIILAGSCVCVVLIVGVIAANAQKLKATFDPSAYSKNENRNNNNVDYDSSVFGADESTDDSGLEMDQQAEEDYNLQEGDTDILNNTESHQASLQIADGSGTESAVNNGNAVSASGDGTGATIDGGTSGSDGTGADAGAGSGTGTGSGSGTGSENGSGTGGNENGGDSEDDPNYNPDPGRITVEGNPEDENSGNEDRFVADSYYSLRIVMRECPKYYDGQLITLNDIKQYMESVTITLKNNKTNEYYNLDNAIDLISFGTNKDDTSDSITATKDNMVSFVYVKQGLAGTPSTDTVAYTCYDHHVTVNQYDNQTSYASVFTNDSVFALDDYYKDTIRSLQGNEAYVNSDGSLKGLFTGWYQGAAADQSCTHTFDLTAAGAEVVLTAAH